ncbi:hypothetical protein Agub_g2184, partial [Astrephomene gubernaculifera]
MEVAIKIVYEPHHNTHTTNTNTHNENAMLTGARGGGGGGGGRVGGQAGGGGGGPPRTGATRPSSTREDEAAARTLASGRNLHDAFELTVSVSVCHPHIVQVLTFFTDVYVHVDGPTTTSLDEPQPALPQQPGMAAAAAPFVGKCRAAGSFLPSPPKQPQQPHDAQHPQLQLVWDLAQPESPMARPGLLGVAAASPSPSPPPAANTPLIRASRPGNRGGSGGGRGSNRGRGSVGTAGPSRVTLLPYPNPNTHSNLTSCQLLTLDVTTAPFAEYAALQAAMASNGSTAQQTLAASPPAMVICMEYCDAGSLTDAISRGAFRQPTLGLYGSSQPNMKAIFSTLLEVALALRHLHSLRLVHCDLKPSNVLLRSCPRDPRGFTAKLSDFGLVRLMEPCGEGGRLAVPGGVQHGTVTHMAPEVLSNDKSLLHDASLDIYAFGIIMWQLLYGGRLYPGVDCRDIPTRVLREGMRPRFTSAVSFEYRTLAESCWDASPAARPTATELVSALKRLMGLTPQRLLGHRRHSALAPHCPPMAGAAAGGGRPVFGTVGGAVAGVGGAGGASAAAAGCADGVCGIAAAGADVAVAGGLRGEHKGAAAGVGIGVAVGIGAGRLGPGGFLKRNMTYGPTRTTGRDEAAAEGAGGGHGRGAESEWERAAAVAAAEAAAVLKAAGLADVVDGLPSFVTEGAAAVGGTEATAGGGGVGFW